jgi:5-methylcytosine-specific restriction endonuclease McrA
MCNFCKKTFEVRGYRKNTVGYCSYSCRASHQKVLFSGENSWSWKGGKTPMIKLLRTNTDYKKWRSEVFERDGYRCVLCGRGGDINADHIVKFADIFYSGKTNKLYDTTNGRTLCVDCHKQTDTYGNRKAVA